MSGLGHITTSKSQYGHGEFHRRGRTPVRTGSARIMRKMVIFASGPATPILAHTEEVVGGRNGFTTSMRARSSIGRSCLSVCKCAGVGDVGYISQWTMEITNHSHAMAFCRLDCPRAPRSSSTKLALHSMSTRQIWLVARVVAEGHASQAVPRLRPVRCGQREGPETQRTGRNLGTLGEHMPFGDHSCHEPYLSFSLSVGPL